MKNFLWALGAAGLLFSAASPVCAMSAPTAPPPEARRPADQAGVAVVDLSSLRALALGVLAAERSEIAQRINDRDAAQLQIEALDRDLLVKDLDPTEAQKLEHQRQRAILTRNFADGVLRTAAQMLIRDLVAAAGAYRVVLDRGLDQQVLVIGAGPVDLTQRLQEVLVDRYFQLTGKRAP